jgi:hypothetical protein
MTKRWGGRAFGCSAINQRSLSSVRTTLAVQIASVWARAPRARASVRSSADERRYHRRVREGGQSWPWLGRVGVWRGRRLGPLTSAHAPTLADAHAQVQAWPDPASRTSGRATAWDRPVRRSGIECWPAAKEAGSSVAAAPTPTPTPSGRGALGDLARERAKKTPRARAQQTRPLPRVWRPSDASGRSRLPCRDVGGSAACKCFRSTSAKLEQPRNSSSRGSAGMWRWRPRARSDAAVLLHRRDPAACHVRASFADGQEEHVIEMQRMAGRVMAIAALWAKMSGGGKGIKGAGRASPLCPLLTIPCHLFLSSQ